MAYQADEKRYDNIEYRRLGKSGLKIPPVSLGLWHNFGDIDSFDNIRQMCFTAFDNGITHFDLANNYGPSAGSAEINFGRVLKNDMGQYRDELIISTKAGYGMWPGPYGDFGSKKYLIASLDQSLKRMGLEYVDIFYHHRMDPETPLEETMHALDTAVKSGKALYAGLSNYDAETMKRASKILKDLNCPFVINQNSYSILNRTIEENGFKKACREEGKGLIIFCPLSQGLLTDKYLKGIPDNSRAARNYFLQKSSITEEYIKKATALNNIAKERGQTLAQMAISWLFKDEDVTSALIGASRPQQIIENLKAMENIKFTAEELKLIDANS